MQASESRGCGVDGVSERHHLLESQESQNPALNLTPWLEGALKPGRIAKVRKDQSKEKKWADVAMPAFYTF